MADAHLRSLRMGRCGEVGGKKREDLLIDDLAGTEKGLCPPLGGCQKSKELSF